MKSIIVESPSVIRLDGFDRKVLETVLSFKDMKVEFELKKFKHAHWYADKYGIEAYNEKLSELKASRVKSLLFEDECGIWTYSGLAGMLSRNLNASVTSKVEFPEAKLLPWDKVPFKMYPYQEEALGALLKVRHGGIELATGAGKSLIIANLVKTLGLRTVVMAPSVSIARQLFNTFSIWLGKKYVGLYGDGKKDTKKLITIGIAQSLTKVEEGSDAWNMFKQASVVIVDESHLVAAATLAKVCLGVLKDAPYRFFFSATQIRNDGSGLFLDAITGPIVYKLSVKECIEQGYLARLNFTMVQIDSQSSFQSRDSIAMTREHLYNNPEVNKTAASLANKFASRGDQVLILIDEMSQFNNIWGALRYQFGFAHGGGGSGSSLPEAYSKSDPEALVKQFNEGKLPILIGTSCVSIGTDIKSNKVTIYLKGGRSEIEVMQGAVGRSTRKHELVGKDSCEVIDFEVSNIETLQRHSDARREIYESVAPVSTWDLR